MSIIQAIILGIVEGFTEFLPVSSTAHLILTSKFMAIEQTEFLKFFEVFIQSGAILAVVFLYWRKIIHHKSLILNLVISFIPTAVVGFLLHKMIKTVFFESTYLILFMLLIFGCIFIVCEYFLKQNKIKLSKTLVDLTHQDAFLIGLSQSLAVIPGVSRAGAVILIMILLKYRRDESAVFSFLLAVPTILAASLFDLYKLNPSVLVEPANILVTSVGLIVAFISAYCVMKWFIQFLQKNTLIPFGLYRIVLALLLLFSLFLSHPAYADIITDKKLITVDIGKQTLYAWEGGKIVYETKVSTGMRKAPTVTGSFKVRRKLALQDMRGNDKFYGPYYIKEVPYVMYFYQGYAIHGTYWHNKFGARASHGCVNVPVASAEWLYNWADMGTQIEVF